MAKQQQFIDLFAKYDQDKDGEINQEEFIKIITELEVPYQYPGTVTKIIRKLNCANPDKNTLNLQQAKEYYNSFQSISKHQIWKAKIGLLNKVQELKVAFDEPKEESGAAPTAAPGAVSSVEESEKKPQEARINILIGNNQPVYLSEIEGYVEKSETNQKVKPFVKLTFTSKTEQRAKQLEIIGKQNVNSLFSILSEEEPDYADLFKEIHVNSMVNQTKTIFFITTANEEVLQYIQLLGQFFDLSFSTQLIGKFHLRYEFDYDFQKFINEENSNFYDIFTKNCRLSINLKLLNLLKSLKKYLKLQAKENPYMDIVESMLVTSLFHIQQIEGDFQFQNSQSTEYDLESKQQLKEFITEWGVIFDKLTNSGMKIREMLQLLDDTITIQFNGGQWKANVFLRLKNLEKVILQLAKPQEQQQQQPNEPAQLPDSPHVLQKSGSGSSLGSVNSMKKPKAPKPSQAHQQSPELSEESDD